MIIFKNCPHIFRSILFGIKNIVKYKIHRTRLIIERKKNTKSQLWFIIKIIFYYYQIKNNTAENQDFIY